MSKYTKPLIRLQTLNEVMDILKEAYLNDEFDIDDYFRYSKSTLEEIKQLTKELDGDE